MTALGHSCRVGRQLVPAAQEYKIQGDKTDYTEAAVQQPLFTRRRGQELASARKSSVLHELGAWKRYQSP
jgi:hypothetical protein